MEGNQGRSGNQGHLIRMLVILGIGLGWGVDDLAAQGIAADAIYTNGTVLTMDAAGSIVEAVALWGEKILAVGSNQEMEALAGPSTRRVDLAGLTMIPGLYAPHDHFPNLGVFELFGVFVFPPPIGTVTSIDELLDVLRIKADELPPGAWIIGRGFDQTALEEGRQPTRHDLDRVSTDHPIYVRAMYGHIGVANSKALEIAGVTKDTPQPATDGHFRTDPETGEPNGVFEEGAQGMIQQAIPPFSHEQMMEAIWWASNHYASKGVTTLVQASGSRSELLELQAARAKGLFPLRMVFMGRKSYGDLSPGEAGGLLSGFGDNRIRLGAIKLGHDGSNQGYTGYLSEPYHILQDDVSHHGADYRGYPRNTREQLVEMVVELHRAGYQIGIHGNGDAAIDDIIHAFRVAQEEFPRPDARHRIEHAQTSREDQLDAMRDLGITPSFFVGHVYYWGDNYRDVYLGPDRGRRISPLRTAMDRGIRFTIHDDTPVTPIDPMLLLWVAVNRITSRGEELGPEFRIPPEYALRAMTSEAAWQNFEEDIKGSIEPGKLADLVILSDNPLAVDPMTIRDLEVLTTIVGGETVYQR